MTTTTDEAALLRAIAAHPDEDTPRLMYADWCDDNNDDGEICQACSGIGKKIRGVRTYNNRGEFFGHTCQPCNGERYVRKPNGYAERAEFIRLQIALAWPDDQLPKCSNCAGRGEIDYFKGPGATNPASKDCPVCDGDGTNRNAMQARVSELWWKSVSKKFALYGVSSVQRINGEYIRDTKPSLTVTRGFAESLYLPTLADLCERERRGCENCGGRGRRLISQEAPFHSGQIGLVGEYISCDECALDYTGKPTKLALDIIRAHPTITRVVVGDRRPTRETARIPGGGHFFHYYRIAADTPRFIVDRLGENQFSDGAEALDALAVAAGQWLRREAGV